LDFLDQTSQQELGMLVELIEHGDCAVFVGAGISMPIGYPSLQELLNDMANEAEIDDLKEKQIDDDWMHDFQAIRNTLGPEKYRDSLTRIFDSETKNDPFRPIHVSLLNIPFCAYVTTNYDPCLELAAPFAEDSTGMNSFPYPQLRAVNLKGRHIFHLHGYVEPGNPDSVKSVILTHEDYLEAYEKTGIASDFVRTLFSELDVVFIGFGWKDLVLLGTLDKAKRLRATREDFAVARKVPLGREMKNFAIIERDTFEKDKRENDYLGKFGVRPIIYQKSGDSHYLLNRVVRTMIERTTDRSVAYIPSLPEGFHSIGEPHG